MPTVRQTRLVRDSDSDHDLIPKFDMDDNCGNTTNDLINGISFGPSNEDKFRGLEIPMKYE